MVHYNWREVSMRPFGAPVLTDKYLMILTNSAPSIDGKHFRIYDKTSGALVYSENLSRGTYGGCVGLKDGRILVNTGQSGGKSNGTHVFFQKGTVGQDLQMSKIMHQTNSQMGVK